MALKPFALILCLHVAVHHVANSYHLKLSSEMRSFSSETILCHNSTQRVTVQYSLSEHTFNMLKTKKEPI